MPNRCQLLSFFLLFPLVFSYESPKVFTLDLVDALSTETLPEDAEFGQFFFVTYNTGFQFAADLINNRTCDFPEGLLPDIKLELNNRVDFNTPAFAIQHVIDIAESGSSFSIGYPNGETAVPASLAATVYDVAMLNSFAPSSILGDKRLFPFVSRMYISTNTEIAAIQKQILYYENIGGPGWTDVAIISTIDELSIDFSTVFIEQAENNEIAVIGYQQYLAEDVAPTIELNEIKNSGARVIVSSILGDFIGLLEAAAELEIVGDNFVWIMSSTTVSVSISGPSPLLQGVLSASMGYATDTRYSECHFQTYMNADPAQYFGSGGSLPFYFLTLDPFDVMLTVAKAIKQLDDMEMLDGQRIPAQVWTDVIRDISIDGISGPISFEKNGDRIGQTDISYYDAGVNRITVASVFPDGELVQLEDVVWIYNTTDLPDLDIRPPFPYWSCEDGEEGFDETGKTISIRSPDGSDVDDIDIDYHCDAFVDCRNISDESHDCGTNYVVIYIIFGIITFLLMLLVLVLAVFVIIFGIIMKYQRVRASSPYFLLLLLTSIFIGLSSIYAFYGKPHPVACAFQPWLLALPTISMITVLSAKNFRVYRIFRFPFKRVKMSDLELFALWILAMIPALLIVVLWTIISTPSADFVERDGRDHYVCVTGGFTGPPGGYVFFGIFVGYTAIVLIVGAIVSVLARNIPTMFNETKLLTISIYNLGFLGAVIIPVFLVVQPFNPFIAWILRSVAVLYAFTTTMFVQFAPMVFGVIVIDKCRNVLQQRVVTSSSKSNSAPT